MVFWVIQQNPYRITTLNQFSMQRSTPATGKQTVPYNLLADTEETLKHRFLGFYPVILCTKAM
jgi:hypothetical protein